MSLMSPRSFRSITGCTIWVAAACAALTIVLATTRAHAQDKPFSAEELSQAKTYIATKMDPAVRVQLETMAKTEGRKPEELFLTIRAMGKKDQTLGGGSADINIPGSNTGRGVQPDQGGSDDIPVPKTKK